VGASSRSWLAVGATALSAALFGLAFPPRSWSPLAFVALAPFLAAVARGSLRRALALAGLWAVLASWAVGDWFPRSVAAYFGQPLPVAALLFFAVVALMAAPYYAAAVAAWRVLARRFELALPFAAGAAWVAAELGRGRLLTGTPFFIGNPWGLLGYTQVDQLALMQAASVGGIYAVSFALACPNAGLAQLALAWRGRGRRGRAALAAALSFAPAAAAALWGAAALRAAPAPGDSVSVAIAQGNIAVGSQWRSDAYGENLDVYLRLTEAAALRAAPAVVFWPESAMTFFLERDDPWRGAVAAVLARHGVELVAGSPRVVGDPEEQRFTNSVYVLAPDGSLRGRYDKEYLVPLAEYFPLRVDVLRRRFGRVREFSPGTEVGPLPTRAGAAGVLVCNEAMLPEVARARVLAGAELLVNPSNDSWISEPRYTEQQLDIARVRAIEQRRWLVRASTAGPSALVDPYGRLALRTPSLEPALAVGAVEPRRELTPYAHLGDAFALACLGVAVACVAAARRPARARAPGASLP
jgi:apolipoprotein N-acyltransferase